MALIKYFLKYVFLNLCIVNQVEGVRWLVNHEAVGTFTGVLQGYFLEAWVPLLPPQALGANHLLEVGALFLVPLSDEVVNK